MARAKKLTQSEIDGVQYRRAPTWAIAIGQMQNGCAMAFYTLMGIATYMANSGYGMALTVAGVVLTVTRLFDGIIDPFLAVWIDKFQSKFGKLRIMMLIGFAIRSLAVLMLFVWFSDGSHGIVMFVVLYLLNIVGNSIYDIAGNMIPAVATNDPKQRPTVQVWATIFNYGFPMIFSIISSMVLLPMYGNQYTVPYMKHVCLVQLGFAAALLLISFIGLSAIDKPENFKGISAAGKDDVSVKDMLKFLKDNKPFQLYVISAVSDKLAQNVGSQAIVSTLLFGILVGNVQLGTMLTVISMLPGIIFAIIGAKYAGKHGNKEATVKWTWVCTIVATLTAVFCLCIDMKQIGTNTILMVVFFLCLLAGNAAKMCVTTANGAMRADIVDYELDRSGKYLPAVVTATYNFIDQLVTSLGATIATFCVAALGYVNTAPQPGDPVTTGLKWMTMFLYFGLPILGWICTLVAMKWYHLDKAEMVNVQKRIADKKAELTK